MKRSPLVLAGTVVGLTGVLGFHTSPVTNPLGVVAPVASTGVAPATTSRSPTSGPSTPRTERGPVVNYYFGTLSVNVTAEGQKITKVTIASLSDGGNSLSQSIDQRSIPLLEDQALSVQNAHIQGVSGASYTSAGFAMSLQGALQKLGMKP